MSKCTIKSILSDAILWSVLIIFGSQADLYAQVRINEFLASNGSVLADEDGEYSDWIELYNYSSEEVSMAGWSLTDKKSNRLKWVMPGVSIPAGGYLIIFASDKDRAKAGQELHTNFKLGASGDYFALFTPSGDTASVFNPYPVQTKDVSYGVIDDTNEKIKWGYFATPTPGRSNSEASSIAAEPPVLSLPHGVYDTPFTLTLTATDSSSKIYYTTDGDYPTIKEGMLYTGPLYIRKSLVIRAIAVPQDPMMQPSTPVTATYIFPGDVLKQSNTPDGYPTMWGPYSSIDGMAIADYEMDPELTSDPVLAEKIKGGLRSLPIVSVATNKEHFFSHEKNDSTGGIYIYPGGDAGSTGSGYGNGWLRPTSFEYFTTNPEDKNIQINCAVKIHGNASRQAEKTPKHSLRLKFKSDYGPSKLDFQLFGKGWNKEFNQLVLRAGFGYTWCHWLTGQQQQAMFVRDAWAKRMTTHLGHLAPGTRFAHLFINGLYWGLYNPTERPDEDFCEAHLGGDAEDYDVIRINDGVGLEAQAGTRSAYDLLLSMVNNSADYSIYQKMQGLDIQDNVIESAAIYLDLKSFIDFMILNQYAGNTDWDHHNWVAVRPKDGRIGFQWMPWDSELVLCSLDDNVVEKNNADCPSDIFMTLMQKSTRFKMSFTDAVYRYCVEPFGAFAPDSVRKVWQSLIDEVDQAVYAESARWGDYRKDVHPYTSRGKLYTKDDHFELQKSFMINTYFPARTEKYVNQLKSAGLYASVTQTPKVIVNGETVMVPVDTVTIDDIISINGSYKVYYTTDGSDPLGWSSNGYAKKSATALSGGTSIRLDKDCVIKARCYYSTKGWGPLVERRFVVLQGTGISDLEQDAWEVSLTKQGGKAALRLEMPIEASVYCAVYDLSGRLLNREEKSLETGTHWISLPENLPAGAYVVQVRCDDLAGVKSKSLTWMNNK